MELGIQKQLRTAATKIRMAIIEGTMNAKSGHPGGSLSIADLLAYLYFYEMKVDPKDPKMADRDRFVLSKGHAAPALYGTLALKGFFPYEEIAKLRKTGAILQGHPDMKHIPGVDMSSGSLGQGISTAVGMALGLKLDNSTARVYTVLGDGEIQEGQVWEAAMFAAAKKLDNLCVFVDNNNLQIDGTVADVNSPYPIPEKFEAFGFEVYCVNGHDLEQIDVAVQKAKQVVGKPVAIVMDTVKGKGVSFMENQVSWHGSAPNAEQAEQALAELREALAAI